MESTVRYTATRTKRITASNSAKLILEEVKPSLRFQDPNPEFSPLLGQFNDVSSPQPQTADRDHSQCERESGRRTANQSRVNSPAGQWEPGGEDASPMLNPPPPIESCLEVPGGE